MSGPASIIMLRTDLFLYIRTDIGGRLSVAHWAASARGLVSSAGSSLTESAINHLKCNTVLQYYV